MKIKYILISLIIILVLSLGGLLALSYLQTKDFEKQPLTTPYSQTQKTKE